MLATLVHFVFVFFIYINVGYRNQTFWSKYSLTIIITPIFSSGCIHDGMLLFLAFI